MTPLELFIGGERVAGSGPVIDAVNPYLGEAFAQVSTALESDVDAAVEAAATSFESWRRVPGIGRAELLYRLGRRLRLRARGLVPEWRTPRAATRTRRSRT